MCVGCGGPGRERTGDGRRRDRVTVCTAGAGCIGTFLDTSKNRSRRWCTLDGCGVDAKMKRQAARRRSARGGR